MNTTIISKSQFLEIESAINDLSVFVKSDLMPEVDFGGMSEEKALKGMKVSLAKDIIYCYNGLGVGLDFEKPESIAILFLFSDDLYGASLSYEDLETKFFIFNFVKDKVSSLYNTLLTGNGVYGIVSALKKKKKKDLLSKYVILLYRFTSLIAKIDGSKQVIESG